MADFFLKWWAGAYSNPTPAEKNLEPAVAALGVPYRFQHPIWALRYRLDFALPTLKLAIEVDDPSHTGKKKRAADKQRTARLAKAGWTVVRCTNEEALLDPSGALTKMLRAAGIDPKKPSLTTENTSCSNTSPSVSSCSSTPLTTSRPARSGKATTS